jgi:predicted glycosyltransferase
MAALRVKILFYAINGTGLGHLTRLLAIARPMRDLLSALGHQPDLRFVTTSEGSAAAHDFPVYKFPSKSAAGNLPQAEFAASSKLLISHLVAQFSPHVLVTDTVAEGSYGEVSFLLSYVAAAVFVDRHKDAAITASEVYRRHVVLYDKVIVPDHPESRARYPVPKGTKQHFVGPVHGFDSAAASPPEQVRETFQVGSGQRLIYLSGGGGSDTRPGLEHLVNAIAEDPRNHLLVGYGPLHRGPVIYKANVVPLFSADSRQLFHALDAAISAAGYNSYEELLAARVPTLFYAQAKGMDRQDERVASGLKQGWHGALDTDILALEPSSIRASLEAILDGPRRVSILRALQSRPPSDGALKAAVQILSLVPHVQRARLYEAALHHQVDSRPGFVEAHQALTQWWQALCSPAQRGTLEESAVLAWLQPPASAMDWSELNRWGRQLASVDSGLRKDLLKAWAHHGGQDEAEERRRLDDVLAALAERGMIEELPLFLSGLKRPHQRGALLRFAALLDSDGAPVAQRLLDTLKAEGALSGPRLEAILEGNLT